MSDHRDEPTGPAVTRRNDVFFRPDQPAYPRRLRHQRRHGQAESWVCARRAAEPVAVLTRSLAGGVAIPYSVTQGPRGGCLPGGQPGARVSAGRLGELSLRHGKARWRVSCQLAAGCLPPSWHACAAAASRPPSSGSTSAPGLGQPRRHCQPPLGTLAKCPPCPDPGIARARRWRPDWEQAVHLPPRDGQVIAGVARVGQATASPPR
jgi:hypothetical protein